MVGWNENFLDLETDERMFFELERSIYTVEGDLLVLEMRPKQLPHQFYKRLKIKQGQHYENY